MYISFYILAMLSIVISVFGFVKACRLNKKQLPVGNLSFRSSDSWTVHCEDRGKVRKDTTNTFKLVIRRILTKHMLIGLALFGFLLSLMALTRSFIREHTLENFNENELQQLVNRKIGYRIQDMMKIEDDYSITSTITKSQCENIMFSDDDSTGINKRFKDASFQVGVSLVDPMKDNFQIHSFSQPNQIIDKNKDHTWKWKVIPAKPGKNDIILRVTIKLLNDSKMIQKDICFIKTITVKIS